MTIIPAKYRATINISVPGYKSFKTGEYIYTDNVSPDGVSAYIGENPIGSKIIIPFDLFDHGFLQEL